MREAYYALGNALKQQATRVAQKLASPSTPSAGDDLYKQAQDALGQGDLTRARARLEEALRLDEKYAEAHTLLGFTLGQQGSFRRPSAHLERAIALQPESSDAHYHLGVALWYSGEKDRAVAELQQSVKLDPAAGESHAFLGTMLRERGDLPARARQPAARDRAAAVERRRLCGSRHHVSARGPARHGDRAARSRAERAGAGAARAGLERCNRGASLDAVVVRARRPTPSRAEANNTLGRLLGRAGARERRGRGGVS